MSYSFISNEKSKKGMCLMLTTEQFLTGF